MQFRLSLRLEHQLLILPIEQMLLRTYRLRESQLRMLYTPGVVLSRMGLAVTRQLSRMVCTLQVHTPILPGWFRFQLPNLSVMCLKLRSQQ